MTFEQILEKVTERLGAESVEVVTDLAGDPYVVIPVAKLTELLSFLREDSEFAFDCLSNLTGVDAPPDHLEVVYHLFSYEKRHSFTLKVRVAKTSPKVPSVEKIYPTANWQEREAFDLLGVVFEGHSDLRRIMLPDDWIGHPLRKDYKEQEDYHGMETTRPKLFDY